MKAEAGKTKKQPKTERSPGPKPPCGTLSYLAECRGAPQKSEKFLRQGPAADFMNRTVRKYPAER